jgi:glutathione reductase (NADPH)
LKINTKEDSVMRKRFDLAVLGTGAAASTVASQCRSAGWQVAIVDSRPFGGTCALRGCDPKKVLVGAGDLMDWLRRMQGKGVQGRGARIEWAELMKFKRSFTDPVPASREEGFRKAGIATYHGRARFNGPNSVQVGEDVLEASHVVIATGAMPRRLNIPGEELLTHSDQFLELESLPKHIVFIGGGYISVEFAHLALRAGARVTVLHRGERLLEGFDPDLVDQLTQKMRHVGLSIHLRVEVTAIEKSGDHLLVRASTGGEQHTFDADLVVHGAGRVPEIEDLNLKAAHIDATQKGVKLNEYLQSPSNPAVYAAGDAAASGGPPLTPVAGYEGRIVAANLLNGNHVTASYSAVPTVAFTLPPLASVGLSERAAKERGLRFRTHREVTNDWYSSRRVAEDASGFKILIEEGSDQILGAHLLGPHAEETINLFALAMKSGTTASNLRETIFAYPTLASDVQYMI